MHRTHNCVELDTMTRRGAASVLRDLGPRRSEAICVTHVSQSIFWAPNNVIKYDGKTNPSVWLEDYCLACRASGTDDDLFIIKLLPIYLADTVRTWLDHLARNVINSWEDLKEIFIGNFQSTYV
jgi:hypothetical protein